MHIFLSTLDNKSRSDHLSASFCPLYQDLVYPARRDGTLASLASFGFSCLALLHLFDRKPSASASFNTNGLLSSKSMMKV